MTDIYDHQRVTPEKVKQALAATGAKLAQLTWIKTGTLDGETYVCPIGALCLQACPALRSTPSGNFSTDTASSLLDLPHDYVSEFANGFDTDEDEKIEDCDLEDMSVSGALGFVDGFHCRTALMGGL